DVSQPINPSLGILATHRAGATETGGQEAQWSHSWRTVRPRSLRKLFEQLGASPHHLDLLAVLAVARSEANPCGCSLPTDPPHFAGLIDEAGIFPIREWGLTGLTAGTEWQDTESRWVLDATHRPETQAHGGNMRHHWMIGSMTLGAVLGGLLAA